MPLSTKSLNTRINIINATIDKQIRVTNSMSAGQSGWYPGQVQTGPPGPHQVPANPTVIQFAPPPEYGQPVLTQGLPPPKSAYNIQSPYNYAAPSNQMPPQRAVLIDRQISNVTMVGGCPYCQVSADVTECQKSLQNICTAE